MQFKEEMMPRNCPSPTWMIRYDCKEEIQLSSVAHAQSIGVSGVALDCVKEFFFNMPKLSLALCPFKQFDELQNTESIHGFKLCDPMGLVA